MKIKRHRPGYWILEFCGYEPERMPADGSYPPSDGVLSVHVSWDEGLWWGVHADGGSAGEAHGVQASLRVRPALAVASALVVGAVMELAQRARDTVG